MQFFYCRRFEHETAILEKEEARHCKVLRKQPGDALTLIDGKGGKYLGRLSGFSNEEARVNLESFELISRPARPVLRLCVSPTKQNERMEWMLEKAIEIGVDEIYFILSDHSEKFRINFDRLQRIAISAIKQSIQFYLPVLYGPVSFRELEMKDVVLFAHCREDNSKQALSEALEKVNAMAAITMMIGPEGDFSKEEIDWLSEKHAIPVSLGPNRLRTETACIYSLALINALRPA